MERATGNSSAPVCLPARQSFTRWASCAGLTLGPRTTQPTLRLGVLHAPLVRILIKSDSNSAIIPRML